MKVYISQPVQGYRKEDVVRNRRLMEDHIKALYPDEVIEFTNPYRVDWEGMDQVNVLSNSLKLLGMSDLAYFSPNWPVSKGCQMDALFCELYHIPMCIYPEKYSSDE